MEKYSYTIPARRKKRRKKSLTSWIMEFSKKESRKVKMRKAVRTDEKCSFNIKNNL